MRRTLPVSSSICCCASSSSFSRAAISSLGATGNQILGNRIGVDVTGTLTVSALGGTITEDGETKVDLAGLDPEARYRRFFTAAGPPADYVERLSQIAERRGVGVVAVDVL